MLLQPIFPLLLVLGLFALSDASTMNAEPTTVDQNVHPFQDPRDFFPHMQRILARVNTYGLDQDVNTFSDCYGIVDYAKKKGEEKKKDFLPSKPKPTSRRKALLISVRNIHREIAILLEPFCDSFDPKPASHLDPGTMKNPLANLRGHMARVVYTNIIPRFGLIIQGEGLPNPPKDHDDIRQDLPKMQSALILRVAASALNLHLHYNAVGFEKEAFTDESWSVKDLNAKRAKRFLKAASEAIDKGQGTKPNEIPLAVHWTDQSYKDHTDAKAKRRTKLAVKAKSLSKAAKTRLLRITGSFTTNALKKMGKTIPGKGPMMLFRPVQGRMEAFRIVQGFESIQDEQDTKAAHAQSSKS